MYSYFVTLSSNTQKATFLILHTQTVGRINLKIKNIEAQILSPILRVNLFGQI
jgi:hypothetical protein